MFPEILKDPQTLNLLFSSALFFAGLIVYWLHPQLFSQHTFAERALEFWVLKWMIFVVTWGLLEARTDLRFVLAANDLNSVIGFGLLVALWQGDSYNERHTIMNLVFLFGLMFSWNFLSRSIIGAGNVWIFPSMTLSLIYISSMGYVILARYGKPAIPFAIASVAYLLLQLPTYQLLFINKVKTDPELVKWLAFGKVLYGTFFYVAFFAPIQNFQPMHLPTVPVASEKWRKAINWTLGAIGSGILTELTLWLGKQIWHLVTGHPAAT